MNRLLNRSVILVLVFALIAVPFGTTAFARGEEEDKDITAGKMAVDAVIIRPLGIIATVLGVAFFVVSLPFSALGGNTKEAADRLVKDPAKFTFTRPLGDL